MSFTNVSFFCFLNPQSSPATTTIKRDQFPRSISVFNNKVASVQLNVRPFGPTAYGRPPTDNFYYVGNALVTDTRDDLTTTEGGAHQILYIVDEVLAVFEPLDLTPNALEFLENPGAYGGLSGIDVKAFLTHVRRHELESVFSAAGQNTFFVPVNLDAGKKGFDRYVIKAHVLPKQNLFVRTLGEKVEHNTLASDGKLSAIRVSFCSTVNTSSHFSTLPTLFSQH